MTSFLKAKPNSGLLWKVTVPKLFVQVSLRLLCIPTICMCFSSDPNTGDTFVALECVSDCVACAQL